MVGGEGNGLVGTELNDEEVAGFLGVREIFERPLAAVGGQSVEAGLLAGFQAVGGRFVEDALVVVGAGAETDGCGQNREDNLFFHN